VSVYTFGSTTSSFFYSSFISTSPSFLGASALESAPFLSFARSISDWVGTLGYSTPPASFQHLWHLRSFSSDPKKPQPATHLLSHTTSAGFSDTTSGLALISSGASIGLLSVAFSSTTAVSVLLSAGFYSETTATSTGLARAAFSLKHLEHIPSVAGLPKNPHPPLHLLSSTIRVIV